MVSSYGLSGRIVKQQKQHLKDKQILGLTDDVIRTEITHVQHPLIISKSFVHCIKYSTMFNYQYTIKK